MIAPGLLLLADSRLPSGGHGHSGGVEAVVSRGLLHTTDDLAAYVAGRLRTGGATLAAAAAAACALGLDAPTPTQRTAHSSHQAEPMCRSLRAGGADWRADWGRWDAAVSARIPSAALRAASRAQGAALLRTVSLAWPGPAVDALRALGRVHHPLVLGVAAAGAGATPGDAAALALHHLVGGACTAAIRLLGLDPLAVAAVSAAAARSAGPVAASATEAALAAVAADDPTLLPADGSPLFDVFAQLHDSAEVTLFAS